jgi:AraC-like DNA-binding protein
MLSDSAIGNEMPTITPSDAAATSPAAAAFYSSDHYTLIRETSDLTPRAPSPVAPSILPELGSATDGEERSLHQLLLDEVESVHRLYKVVSDAGCDIVFYDETGQLAGRYGKSRFEGHRLPARRPPAPMSPLASPIFNADGCFVGSLDLASAGSDCTGPAAVLMQRLVRSTAHAVEERAFRKRHAREWIVALAPLDEADCGVLLAVDRNHRVVGADRRARAAMLANDRDASATAFWSLFEKNATIFGHSHAEDKPVLLTRIGAAEPWPALITPPTSDCPRTPVQLDLHARPRLDLVGCFRAPANIAPSRGGLAPGALRRVREYITGHLAENIRLEALAEVADLSRCYFARAFKQSVGTSPHAYMMQERLERAKRLLAETNLSLGQVALDSGFSDQSHFSSCFRRHSGVSPRSFRRSRR